MTDFARNAVRQTVLTLAAITALSAAAFGPARADYPDRQITLIVCFPTGGGTDIAARLINTHLADILGKPVITENRGGAGGSIGTATAARAAPDGYKDIIDKAGLKIK